MRRVPEIAVDVALAAAVVAVGLAEVWVPLESRQGAGSPVASTVTVLAAGLALTQRRRHPLPSGLAVLAAWPVLDLVTGVYVLFFGGLVPIAVAVFSMARHGRDREPLVGAAATAVALLYLDLSVAVLQSPGEIVFHWGVLAIAWGFGFGLRSFERRAAESTRRAVEAEVRAAERAMAAVVEERTRIARELHDVVAHAVSMMVVQAGAAEQVVDDDPEHVRRALATIRGTGADALAEMRRVVAMLRDADEPGALAPQPGLDGLASLLAEVGNGLSASLDVSGDVRPLPAGLDLAAYRIVQEAVTNVRRHARASRVDVRIAYDRDAVSIEVVDDGCGSSSGQQAAPAGHGLVGMRERAALYGGTVDVGPADGQESGFRVRAVLPVAAGEGAL